MIRTAGLAALLLLTTAAVVVTHAQERSVTDQTTIVSFEALNYPTLGRSSRLQGAVVVRVTLDDGGKVANAAGVSGNALLVKESIANVKKWRFQPNARHTAIVVYEFKLVFGACEPLSQFILHGNHATITSCEVEVQETRGEGHK